MKPKSYDQRWSCWRTFAILPRAKRETDFRRRIDALRVAHADKRTLIERLRTAGL
jgi:hypothetical protein